MILPRSALFVVKISNKGTERLETIVTLQGDILGDAPTLTVICSLLSVITTFQFLETLKNYDSNSIIDKANEVSERDTIFV